MKLHFLFPFVMTGCISVQHPVAQEELLRAKNEEPFGFIAMTVSSNQDHTRPLHTYFQVKVSNTRTKKSFILRAEKNDIKKNTAENGQHPVVFKVKPGRYLLSEFNIKTNTTNYKGRYLESSSLSFPIDKHTAFDVKQNEIIHTGIFNYKYTDYEKDGLVWSRGNLETTFARPPQKTWEKHADILKKYNATFIQKSEEKFSTPVLSWKDDLVAN